jgi:hypothetical protein
MNLTQSTPAQTSISGMLRVAGGYPAMARQRHPSCHRSAGQGRSFLEGEMVRHSHESFLTQHGVFRQHPVQVGARLWSASSIDGVSNRVG